MQSMPQRTDARRAEEEQLYLLGRKLRALSSPVRMRILRILMEHPPETVHVTMLIDLLAKEGVELFQPTVSHHLLTLFNAGFVGFTKRGLYNYYYVKYNTPFEAIVSIGPVLEARVLQ